MGTSTVLLPRQAEMEVSTDSFSCTPSLIRGLGKEQYFNYSARFGQFLKN